jgi:hypothetical protein
MKIMKIAINKTQVYVKSSYCFDIVVIGRAVLSNWPRQYSVYRDLNHIEDLYGTMFINWRPRGGLEYAPW